MQKENLMRFFILCILCFTVIDFKTDSQMTAVADESVHKMQAYDEFSQLSLEKQKDRLVHAFEKRIKHAHNLFYRLEETLGYKNYNGSDLEEFVTFRRTYSHWTLDRSYLMQVEMLPQGGNSNQQIVTIYFDSKDGITKNYIKGKNELGELLQGRIDTTQDPIVLENFYTSWLDVNLQLLNSYLRHEDYYIFPCLLKYRDTWEIELDIKDKMVRLTSVYPPSYIADRYEGKRLLILDPEKDFMPFKEEYRWEATARNFTFWVEGGFVVEDSQIIDDVWMPLKMITHYRLKTNPDIVALIKMNITEIKHGNITKTDVTMRFPEKAEIVDAINGISYKTDANGEPIESTIEPLYGLDPSQVKLPEKKLGKANYVLIVIGLLLILTAIYLMFHKNKKAS